jgi:hypothetical protein
MRDITRRKKKKKGTRNLQWKEMMETGYVEASVSIAKRGLRFGERKRMAQKLRGEEVGGVERMTWRRRDERDDQIQNLGINYGLQF